MTSLPRKTFYFIRHGETDANAKGLMCGGGWDIDLNESGIEQSSRLASKLSGLTPQISKIYVSPMKRAQQTAKNINSITEYPVVIENDLAEWYVGDWERKPWNEVPNPFETLEDPINGETREVFENRVLLVIKNVLEKSESTVLFVSHGAFAHVLFTAMNLQKIKIENCQLYRISYQKNCWNLAKLTD